MKINEIGLFVQKPDAFRFWRSLSDLNFNLNIEILIILTFLKSKLIYFLKLQKIFLYIFTKVLLENSHNPDLICI